MKYLKNFKTKEEYDQFRGGAEYLTPNVSFVETTGSIINDSVQIDAQDKEVEITENGEVEITPDAGYAYLSSVNVKTNIEGGNLEMDDILYFFTGSGSGNNNCTINLTTQESVDTYTNVVFSDDKININTGGSLNIVGLSMLSPKPFVVEKLDDTDGSTITSAESCIESSTNRFNPRPIWNYIGSYNNDGTGFAQDVLRGGGLFKLTTGYGKEYVLNIN